MRRISLVLLLASVATAASAGPAAGLDRCAKKGSRTAKSTKKVRVYWAEWQSDCRLGCGYGTALYGCVRETGITRTLFVDSHGTGNYYTGIRHLRVNRYRVAFSEYGYCTVCSDKASDDVNHLMELRGGRHRVLERVRDYNRSRGGARVDALILDRCGRLAYRAQLTTAWGNRDEHDAPRLLTWIRGRRHLVDRGEVERRSIRFEPESLHWTRDGVKRSAPVEPTC